MRLLRYFLESDDIIMLFTQPEYTLKVFLFPRLKGGLVSESCFQHLDV